MHNSPVSKGFRIQNVCNSAVIAVFYFGIVVNKAFSMHFSS